MFYIILSHTLLKLEVFTDIDITLMFLQKRTKEKNAGLEEALMLENYNAFKISKSSVMQTQQWTHYCCITGKMFCFSKQLCIECNVVTCSTEVIVGFTCLK